MRAFAVIPIEQLLRREDKCPLSVSDEKGKKYCVVEGKIRGINPLTGNDPADYTGCDGNIFECPYDNSKREAALREKKEYIEKVLKDEINYLEGTIYNIRQKCFQL